jgi:hypothetical protein
VNSRYCRRGDTGLHGIKDGHCQDRIKEVAQEGGLGDLIRDDSAITSCAIRMHEMNQRSLFKHAVCVGCPLRSGSVRASASLRIRLAVTFKRWGTQRDLAVGWRNSPRCKVRLARQGIVIKRSAADRFGVFGAAGALKKSRAVMTAVTRCVRRRSDSITERGSSNRRDVHFHFDFIESPL